MGAILANAMLALTPVQIVCIIVLIVVIIGYVIWKKKQE